VRCVTWAINKLGARSIGRHPIKGGRSSRSAEILATKQRAARAGEFNQLVLANAEVRQFAALLTKKFGQNAVDEAQQRAKEALDADDIMATGTWLTVAWAVREVVRPARPKTR
jgi:hypothetical protein